MAAVKPEGESLAASGFADLALFEERPADAVAILEPAITHDAHMKLPGVAAKYLTLAEARADQGRPADAILAVDQALATSRHEDVLLPAAQLLVELDRESRAAALARELASRTTERAHAYSAIVNAQIAMHRGNAAGAIEMLRGVVQSTDLWLARFTLGTAFLQAQRFDEAQAEFATCQLRRSEAVTLFDDETPTLRYLRVLDQYLRAAATHSLAGM
jgi:lipopolysaccharide biosynthesis regulator YciM